MDRWMLLALFIFQAQTQDYGGYFAPGVAIVCAGFTVWSQIRQKKLENELGQTRIQHESQQGVLEAWQKMVDRMDSEMKDMRVRLRMSDMHSRICERNQLKLVQSLIKAGVDIDLDKIMMDMEQMEKAVLMEVHLSAAPTNAVGTPDDGTHK